MTNQTSTYQILHMLSPDFTRLSERLQRPIAILQPIFEYLGAFCGALLDGLILLRRESRHRNAAQELAEGFNSLVITRSIQVSLLLDTNSGSVQPVN